MVLVPEDAVNRYEQRQRLERSPVMSNTIEHANFKHSSTGGCERRSKQKLFNAEFERYLELRQQKDRHIPNVCVVDNVKGQQKRNRKPNYLTLLLWNPYLNDAPKGDGPIKLVKNKT